MSSDRLKAPPERDYAFYQRRKHDKWRAVPAPEPALEGLVADSHAHLHMFEDPAWELVRCSVNQVDYLCMIVDPAEDGRRPFDELDTWLTTARAELNKSVMSDARPTSDAHSPQSRPDESAALPTARIAVGIHPHSAKHYSQEREHELIELLKDSRVGALGEIGLDFHYDFSPREAQREAFRRQIRVAHRLHLPIALHLRDGADYECDNAHVEAFDLLQKEGFPAAGVLLHCCTLAPEELQPWVEAGCSIAFGGALTFKNAEPAREGARLVPVEQILLETDAPFMTPEPMRGALCTPAHVIFTAAALAEMRGIAPGAERERFLAQIHDNTLRFYAHTAQE